MTKFEILKGIGGVKEFSRLVWGMVEKAETPEKLAEALSEELPDVGLQTLESIAQSGDYPLSLGGKQKETEIERLAVPLIRYLRDNYHPYTSVVITDSRIAVVETVLSIPNSGIG